jgi:DNA-binding transcriptional LysR family regulator
MDLHQLQAFDQIVLQGNFSKAARALAISQPTISLRIQALEQEVGGALFIRGGRKLQLTELGRSFLPYARQALSALTTGVDIARRTMHGKRGHLTVGTLPSLATGFFASTLLRLHTTHPELDIAVHTGHNQQIVEMLYDSYVSLGFMIWPFFRPEMIPLLHIREPLLVVTHATHPLAQKKQITVAELIQQAQPFFHIDWNIETKHWQTQISTSVNAMIEVPPQTAYDLLLRGIGAALLTRPQITNDLKAGTLVEITISDLPAFARESVLVRFKRDEPLSSAATEFLRVLREEAREYCLPSITAR